MTQVFANHFPISLACYQCGTPMQHEYQSAKGRPREEMVVWCMATQCSAYGKEYVIQPVRVELKEREQ